MRYWLEFTFACVVFRIALLWNAEWIREWLSHLPHAMEESKTHTNAILRRTDHYNNWVIALRKLCLLLRLVTRLKHQSQAINKPVSPNRWADTKLAQTSYNRDANGKHVIKCMCECIHHTVVCERICHTVVCECICHTVVCECMYRTVVYDACIICECMYVCV